MGELFDDVARTLATTPSRRKALRTVAGALASAALINLWPRTVAAKTCPAGQVACGPTGQCLPITGESWVCCGYAGSPRTGTACGPGQCNSSGVCCQGGGKTCGAQCCRAGESCCDATTGLCCPANQQCQNGKCVPRGSGGGGGGSSCPPGHPICGGSCCAPNEQCLNGTCVRRGSGGGGPGGGTGTCPPGSALCGTSGQCCPTSGMGQCCGSGASAACCWGGTCVSGVCVYGGGGPPRG
jgi:hypothetical protein